MGGTADTTTANGRLASECWWGRVAAVLAIVAGLGFGTAGPVSASAPPTSDGSAAPVGEAVPITPGVEWRAGAGGTYAAVSSPQAVAEGDGVRTDGTGFAEVAYSDGSRTRLDVDTEFEVVALVDDAGNPTTRTAMGLGRTWHRVQALGATGGGFEVETSQAVAVVRGTAFLVSCLTVESCDFTVMEGTVDVVLSDGTVIPVVGPATLDVTSGAATGPVPITWDGLFGDPWVVDNTDLDVTAGFADSADVFAAYGPTYASMVGSFTGTRTITSLTCAVAGCEAFVPPVGDVAARTYTFAVDCSGGAPCTASVVAQAADATVTVPASFDGTTLRWSLQYDHSACWWDDDGDGNQDRSSGSASTSLTYEATPHTAAVVDGAWLVTGFSGSAVAEIVTTDLADCGQDQSGRIETSAIEVTRQ